MEEKNRLNGNLIRTIHYPILLGSLAFAFLEFFLPIYGKEMGASAVQIGGLFSIWAIAVALLRPLVGIGLDRFGRKPFFVAAILCFAGAMLVFAFSADILGLFGAQLLRGLGSAMMWISAYTIATDLASPNERGRSVGHVDEATARGQLYGGVAGFVLITMLPGDIGWQVVFLIYAAMGALGAFFGWRSVPETRPAAPSMGPDEEKLSAQLYKLMTIVFITAASSSMIRPIFIIFLQDKFTTDITILVLAIIPSGIVSSYLPSRLGRLSDRFGRSRLMSLGLIGSGLLSFFLPQLPGIGLLAALWTIESVGWAIAAPAEEAMVADLTGRSVRGRGYGLYTLSASLGAVAGPLLGGWLYDVVGEQVPFYLNGMVLLIGALLVLIMFGSKNRTVHRTDRGA
jgi:DHA1 family multidrug resistance protein-like MFS transporter